MNKRLVFSIVFLLLLTGLSIYLLIHFDIYLLFEDRNKLVNFITSYPYDELIFILLQIIQVVAAPIPGELTGLIGGYLYGPFWGTVYSTIGLTIGSWLAFLLARFFGMPLIEKVVKRETIEKFDQFMEHQGILVSFLLFLIPGFPKDYLCYIMGVSSIPTWTFIIVVTAGRLFGTIMLSITGNIARNEQYVLLAVIVGVGIAIFIAAYYYHDKMLEMLKRKKK
ncbi:MAG: TVP38/TMEM64 family protein [Smithellaceae bacterium]|jgi:uncharacterized membrane protein YdjX (TVP38/TMEM64 family)